MMVKQDRNIEMCAGNGLVSDIETAIAVRAMGQTSISKFWEHYNPEKPDKVRKLVASVTSALEDLTKIGGDIGVYFDEIRQVAFDALTNYQGQQHGEVEKSTALTVAHLLVHWFALTYNPEDTAETKRLASRTAAYLRIAHELGYANMRPFLKEMQEIAITRFGEYKGESKEAVFNSTIYVHNEVYHRPRSYAAKRKTTRMLRRKK